MAWWRVPRASVGVGVVGVLAGLIVAANAVGAGEDPERAATDLVSLARAQTGRLEDLQDENSGLREQIAPYLVPHSDDPAAVDPSVQAAAGSVSVAGPGVEVALTDAPVPDGGIPEDRVPDDYVVHQLAIAHKIVTDSGDLTARIDDVITEAKELVARAC